MADAFPISGSIDSKAFPFLLMDLHRQGATGSLKVDGPSYQKALYFRSGRILFGSSNDPRDQLGSILIESGKITPEQLEDVNSKVGPGNPLAKVLAETGFVNQRELSEAARAKVERILSDVISYASGSFEFEDGVLPKGAVDLKLSTERLVLAAVRRVSDRNFVLRHIGGLDLVLAPTPTARERLAEIEGEAGGVPEAIDGKANLKEVASRARVEEFEAAKVACALLFLGLAVRTEEAPPASTGFALVEPESELDLSATAREAFARDDARTRTPPPDPEPEAEPFAAAPPAAAFVPAAPVTFPRSPTSPSRAASPRSLVDTEPEIAIEPPAPRPAPLLTPPPQPRPNLTQTPLPHIPPHGTPARPSAPLHATTETQGGARPSKEDLAALDALLNPRTLEGPLAPLEKRSPAPAWTPQFGARGGARRPAGGSRKALGLLLGLLVAAAGGAYWYFLRTPEPAPVATPSPEPVTVVPIPLPTAQATPAAPPSTSAPDAPLRPSPAAAPLTTPPPTTLPARGGVPSLSEARTLLRQAQYDSAAQGFLAHVRSAPARSASVQLLIACSADTVEKALSNVSSQELFILPVSYQGRACHRLCWGLYPDEAAAARAIRGVPEYFRAGGAKPRVLSRSQLLP